MSDFVVPFENNFVVSPGSVDTSVIATRAYVDAIFQNLDWKGSVRAISAAALPAYTRVGNVITANANGALPSVNGITLLVNERLALKDGAAGADNGLYSVTQVGTGSLPFILTRTTDADSSAKFTARLAFEVEEGTNAGLWHCTNTGVITLNTTSVTLAQFSGGASLGTDVGDIQPVGIANVLGASVNAAPINHAHKFAVSGQTTGDIIYFDGTNWVRLAKSTDGKYLSLASGFPAWATLSSFDPASPGAIGGTTPAAITGTTITGNTSVLTNLLDARTATTLAIGTTTATGIGLNQTTTLASNKNLVAAGGTSQLDWSAASGVFKTSTGAVSINGDTTLAAGKSFTAAAGSGALNFGSATGNTDLTTGHLTWAGAFNKFASFSTSGASGTIVFQADAPITINSANEIRLQSSSANVLYVGSVVTVAANKNLVAQSGTSQLDWSAASGVFKTSTGAVSINGSATMASGKTLALDSGTATGSGLAVTLNKQVGVITTEALTTNAGVSETYTITNSLVTTASRIFCQSMGGTNTTPFDIQRAVPGTGSFTVKIFNSDNGSTALNGTVVFSFIIL